MNEPQWIKSSYSSNVGPQCVEAAKAANAVPVRDSKNTTGPNLAFPAPARATFPAHAARR